MEEFVIKYLSDIAHVVSQAKRMERINKLAADKLGKDFTHNIDLISSKMDKLQFNKSVKFPVIDGEGKEKMEVFSSTVATFSENFRTAEGALFKFSETVAKSEAGTRILASSITAVNEKADKLMGSSSQLATNFSKVSDVNSKFAKQLSEFGKATTVVSSQTSKVTDNTKQIVSVVQTADGQFLKLTETVKKTADGMQQISRSAQATQSPIKEMANVSSQLATNFKSFSDVNAKFSGQLGQLGNVTNFLGTTLNQVTDAGSRTTKIFETANGKFVALTETTKRTADGQQLVTRTTKEMNKEQLANVTTLEKGKLATRGFADNLSTLLKRAALTIPVWFAIRRGIGAIFTTIRDGLTNIVSFERSLAKIRQNLLATSTDTSKDLGVLREAFTKLSIESGVSTDKIANAFQKFATVGFNFEDSLAGTINTTKLAVTLFGDAEETADAFARALRVLIDKSDGAKNSQTQIAEAMALTSQLWKTNQFDIKEVNEALEKFAPAAKAANLSMQETTVLLATLGTAATGGARGGTLLKTTFLKLLSNLDEVSSELGITITKFDTSFTIIGKVVEKLNEMGDSLDGVRARSEVVADVFGGIRSALPLQALSALNDVFKENSKLLPDVGKFGKEYNDLTESLPILVDRFKVLNVEIGKSFVTGLVGGENFTDTMSKLVSVLEKLQGNAENIGKTFSNAFGQGAALLGVVGASKLAEAGIVRLATRIGVTLPASFIAAGTAADVFATKTLAVFTKIFKFSIPFLVVGALGFIKTQFESIPDLAGASGKAQEAAGAKIAENINKGIKGKLSAKEIQDLIIEIETFGGSNLGQDQASLDRAVEKLKIELEIARAKERQIKATEKEAASVKNTTDIRKALLNHSLEMLKLEGATQAQILKATALRQQQLGLTDKGTEALERQLALERAIAEEKRLSNDLSSESLKLFKIAQSEGKDVAKIVGDVLAKDIDFDRFVQLGSKNNFFETPMNKALEVFKRDFGDVFESQQAKKFFKGEGRNINIQERRAVDGTIPALDPTLSIRLMRETAEKQEKSVNENVEALNRNTESIKELMEAQERGVILGAAPQKRLDDFRTNGVPSQNVERFMGNMPLSQNTTKQTVDISVDIDGKNISIGDNIEDVRSLANQMAPHISEAIADTILKNSQAPISKAVTHRLLEG